MYDAQPKIDFIDNAVTDIGSNAILLQQDIIKKLNEFFTEFDIKDGRFIDNSRALQVLNDLEEEIKSIIDKSKYNADVLKLVRTYDDIKRYNIAAQKSINGIIVTAKDVDKFKRVQINTTVDLLVGQGIDVNFVQPMTQALMNNIILGATLSDTKQYLQEYAMGAGEKMGALERYSTQVARDLLHSYDGKINQQIAIAYDLNALMYVGSIKKDSRPQCKRWVEEMGGQIMNSQLASEIQWAFENGSGMKDGTTEDNFCVNRGGWNCRHTAIPFRLK